jgi:hypothetical protein
MCSSGTPDVIDTIPNEDDFDSGVDADPTVEPNVIPAEAGKVCFPHCFSYLYHKFIILPQPEHPSSQVDISDSISIATVVEETTGDHTTNDMPSLPFTESITCRPKSINLDDIPLNSPSSQIVGTPFAIDNTRFEYPFPVTNQFSSSGSSSGTSLGTSDFSASSPSTSSSTSFPTLSTSSQILTHLSFPPPSHHPSCNTTHPKMKLQTNPPIPPNLVKRRLRRDLEFLGRRKSSTGSQHSATSDDSATSSNRDGPASPPGLDQERVKR